MIEYNSARGRNETFYAQGDYYRCLELWINSDRIASGILELPVADVYAKAPNLEIVFADDAETRIALARQYNLLFAQDLVTTDDYKTLITEVRAVLAEYNDTAPAFASGIPFLYWEQYMDLRDTIFRAVGFSLAAAWGMSLVLIVLVRPRFTSNMARKPGMGRVLLVGVWGASIITFCVAVITGLVYGFLGFAEIKLNAIPIVTLIMSVGIGIEMTAHLALVYTHSAGTRHERTVSALHHMFAATFDGSTTTLLGVLMLGFSQFQFVQRYYFLFTLIIVVFGAATGLLLLPVLLSLIGPPSLYTARRDSELSLQPKGSGYMVPQASAGSSASSSAAAMRAGSSGGARPETRKGSSSAGGLVRVDSGLVGEVKLDIVPSSPVPVELPQDTVEVDEAEEAEPAAAASRSSVASSASSPQLGAETVDVEAAVAPAGEEGEVEETRKSQSLSAVGDAASEADIQQEQQQQQQPEKQTADDDNNDDDVQF